MDPLDSYKHLLPRGIAECALDAFSAEDPSRRFIRLVAVVEAVAQHLARLALSEYACLGRPVPAIDRVLGGIGASQQKAQAQAFTYGDFEQVVRACLRKDGLPDNLGIPELADLRCEDVPPEWDGWVKDSTRALDARHNLAPTTTVRWLLQTQKGYGRSDLFAFLKSVTRPRNLYAHPEVGAEDRDWYVLLNERLEPAVRALLGWEPARRVLTRYEIVSAKEDSTGSGARWRTPVDRDLPLALVPIGGTMWVTSTALSRGSSYVAARDESLCLQGCVYLVRKLGDSLADRRRLREDGKRDYQKGLLDAMLSTGGVPAAVTRGLAEERGIEDATAEALGRETWDFVLASKGVRPGGLRADDAMRSLETVVGDGRGPGWLISWWARAVSAVEEHLARQSEARVLTVESLSGALGMPPDLVRAILPEVCAPRAEVEGRRAGSSWRLLVDDRGEVPQVLGVEAIQADAVDRYCEVFEQARAGFDREKPWHDSMRKLLSLAYELLPDVLKLEGKDPQDLPLGSAGEEQGASPRGSRECPIWIRGERYTLASPTLFFEAIYERMGDSEEFARTLPWTWGRVRRLAASSPDPTEGEAAAGRKRMSNPRPVGRVFFDQATTREEVAYCAVQHLRRAGVDDARIEVAAGPSMPTTADLPAGATGDGGDAPVGIVVDPGGGVGSPEAAPEEIAGASAAAFCARFLEFFVDRMRAHFDALPLKVGRSKVFVSLRPDHGDPARPFRAPAVYRDVYVETDLSADDAVRAALAACRELGVAAGPLSGDDAGFATEVATAPVWHLNAGERSEPDMLRVGFWQAGGGRRQRTVVERLSAGDLVYLYRNGAGYVAAGVVTGGWAERLETFAEGRGSDLGEGTLAHASASAQAPEDLADYVRTVDWRWRAPEGGAVRARDFVPDWITPVVTGCRIRRADVQAVLAREFGVDRAQDAAAGGE